MVSDISANWTGLRGERQSGLGGLRPRYRGSLSMVCRQKSSAWTSYSMTVMGLRSALHRPRTSISTAIVVFAQKNRGQQLHPKLTWKKKVLET